MNIAEQQAITHTSFISPYCFRSSRTYSCRHWQRRNTRAPTCASSPAHYLSNTHNITRSHRVTRARSNLRTVPFFFCLWHCVSGKPGCELTPPCFSRLLCYAWHLLCAQHAHTHTHIAHTQSHTLPLCHVLLINWRNRNSFHSCLKDQRQSFGA